jgi:hypothetical protein
MSAIYDGLSEKSKLWIIGIGALVAVGNLTLAWIFAFNTEKALALREDDMKPYQVWMKDMGGEKLSEEVRHDVAARAMHIVALTKMTSNKNALTLACFGAAFALSALGFSLFIIGADGAFKVAATSPDKSSLAIAGTAPGLMCFVIAGALVAIGIVHRNEISMPEMPARISLESPTVKSSACEYQSSNGTCYTAKEFRELAKGNK